ncbi:MAG: methyltransferase domain-containing protein [Anaerolineae bacterium]
MTKEDPTRWYDRIARLYDPFILGSYSGVRKRTMKQLRLKPGQTVLDVACGTGENFRFILEQIGPTGTLIGTDFSAGMLAQARRKVEKNDWQNVHLLHADARALSLEMLRAASGQPDLDVDRVRFFGGAGVGSGVCADVGDDGRKRPLRHHGLVHAAKEHLYTICQPHRCQRHRPPLVGTA